MYTPIRTFTKVSRQFDKINANKINKLPLKEYFDDLMRRRQLMSASLQNHWEVKSKRGAYPPKPLNETGYISLPQ